jgi:predicted unusual protein kinase regulating ubiquinone biosynthesis (AarF/ABC1/UbiB family)
MEQLVRLDLRNLEALVGVVARREPSFDYRAIARELAVQIPLELDFEREAAMLTRVRANLAALPAIVVPRPIAGMVSRRVLVLDYLEGSRLLHPGEPLPAGLDGALVARRITEAFGHQILVDGLFQADPHPGNILLLLGGEIGLLDFGLTKELPAAMRLGFCRLIVAAAARDFPAILAAFRAMGVRTRSEGPEAILGLVDLFLGPRPAGTTGLPAGGRRAAAVARNPVEALPSDLVLLGRVVGLLRGVCASLGSPLTPLDMLRPHAERALAVAAGGD